MLELALALVAAGGSAATAYVIHVLGRVERQTNGLIDQLEVRVRELEVALAHSEEALAHLSTLPPGPMGE
jgi:ribosomal silencing factor RsfS